MSTFATPQPVHHGHGWPLEAIPSTCGDSLPRAVSRIRVFAAFVLGFAVLFNTYLNPGAGIGSSLRLTDVLGALLLIIIAVHFLGRGLDTGPAIAVVVMALIPATYAFITLNGGFPGEPALSKTTFVGARWVLAAATGYALHRLTLDDRTRNALVIGLITGAVGNCLVILAQYEGFQNNVVSLGLASSEISKSWVYGIRRPDGMHSMANGSMAVVSLGVPAMFYLYWVGRARGWACFAALGLLAGTSAMTFSRGAVIATILTLSVAIYRYRALRRTMTIAVLLGSLSIGAIVVVGPPGGWTRWEDMASTEQNFDGRAETAELTLGLVAAHPLGVGVDQALNALEFATGMRATHNAVLNSAISFGLGFGIFITGVLLINIVGAKNTPASALYFLLSLQIACLFFLEDLLLSPSVITFFGWLVAGAGGNLLLNARRRSRSSRKTTLAAGAGRGTTVTAGLQ